MTRFAPDFDRLAQGWRGPFFAAMVVLVAALPGLIRLPPLDRDESRFAQATAQMLETGDFVKIRYQDAPRDKKPVGIHWLQALSVALTSHVEVRAIQPYRLPSLLGAMIAAAACAFGASAALGPRGGVIAGSLLGASTLLSSEAFIAKTDAVLAATVVVSLSALFRLYLKGRRGDPLPLGLKLIFWTAQGVSLLIKGPIGPMVAALCLLTLWAMDRDLRWAKKLGWLWGLAVVALIVGPWAFAITVATDGRFWGAAVSGDLAPKLKGGHEGHAAPFGLHAALSPILFFPAAALLPLAVTTLWSRRDEAIVRFAAAWLVPSWLVFELAPTKLIHYPLPLYGALAWLAAAGLCRPVGRRARGWGIGLAALSSLVFAVLAVFAAVRLGSGADLGLALLASGLCIAVALYAAEGLIRTTRAPGPGDVAFAAALACGVLVHVILTGALAPGFQVLWPSREAARMVARAGWDPRGGRVPGPVAVAGFAEPSLVFQLGTSTILGDAQDAADAVAEGRAALVEGREAKAFQAALQQNGLAAQAEGEIKGYNYSSGKPVSLTLWRTSRTPP
jgi:4-amino-4-deoxy-L-arabinose transferase-like glycosyltransferase